VRFFSGTFGAGVNASHCPITRPKRRKQPERYVPCLPEWSVNLRHGRFGGLRLMLKISRIIKLFLPYGLIVLIRRRNYCISVIKNLLFRPKKTDYKNIPIIINNRNHYDYLLRLIQFLEKCGYNNIILLDNASTYPPLLEYYNSTKHRVIRLNENIGHMALNNCSLWQEVKNNYFVYTDPDVVPIDECPENFLEYFVSIMEKDIFLQKVGFSLKIDDLPDCYDKKEKVIGWENQFWNIKNNDGNFIAPVDTTFALHRPGVKVSFLSGNIKHCRTKYPYTARHLPWYEDSNKLSENMAYYYKYAEKGNNW
jgi:hypothetical protein